MEVEIIRPVDKPTEKLEPAKINLTDCLACSGCVTSAESILIEAQGAEEFLNRLKEPNQVVVITISPQALASFAAYYNLSMASAGAKLHTILLGLGAHYMLETSVAHDVGLLYAANEFVSRKRKFEAGEPSVVLPTITASCPGWVCYAEKTHGDFIIPYLSNVKSAQQIMGSIVQGPFRESLGLPREHKIFHVGIMQCYDKKLEASRPDFREQVGNEVRADVDMVLAVRELAQIITQAQINMNEVPEKPPVHPLAALSRTCGIESGPSGGYLDFIFKFAAQELYGVKVDKLQYIQGRNTDFQECQLKIDGKVVLNFARAYGFRNIQNVVRKIKTNMCKYDYVEMMACPGGCTNGGGQVEPPEGVSQKEWLQRTNKSYYEIPIAQPQEDASGIHLIQNWLRTNDEYEKKVFTEYHAVKKAGATVNIDW